MNQQEKKTWLLKHWKLLDGKTLSKALGRYWSQKVVPVQPRKLDDSFEIAKEIFK
jgi:hypothetical protein